MNQKGRDPLAQAITNLAIVIAIVGAFITIALWETRTPAQKTIADNSKAVATTPIPIASNTPAIARAVPDKASIVAAATRWIDRWHALAKDATPVPSNYKLYAPQVTFAKDQTDAFTDFVESEGNVDGTVDRVEGPTAFVTIRYGIPTSANGMLNWQINGSLHFVHGSNGWLIDHEWWTNRRLVSEKLANGEVYKITDSKITGDESIDFVMAGNVYEWTRLPKFSWKIVALETPPPPSAAPAVAETANVSNENANTVSSLPDRPIYNLPPRYMPNADAGCEDVDVSEIYADGEILELSDGRRLRVSDADTATSGVWVAPFDGLICDGGDKFINKDDNESVDLQP